MRRRKAHGRGGATPGAAEGTWQTAHRAFLTSLEAAVASAPIGSLIARGWWDYAKAMAGKQVRSVSDNEGVPCMSHGRPAEAIVTAALLRDR